MAERDLSFLEENGVDAKKRLVNRLQAMEEDEFKTYRLRIEISTCCRTGDVSRAATLYQAAAAEGTRGNASIYANLINLLSGLGAPGSGSKRKREEDGGTAQERDIDTAFMVFGDMKAAGMVPTEACYTALLRALSHAGRCDEALTLLREMQAVPVAPRLRSLSPLLSALSKALRIEDCFSVFNDVTARHELHPGEADYCAMLEVCVGCSDARFEQIFDAFIEDVLVPLPSTREVVMRWFGDASQGYQVRECAVMEDGEIDLEGRDAGRRVQLQSISLQEKHRDVLLAQIEGLVRERDRKGDHWAAFKFFLEADLEKKPDQRFDTVIDGANVGYFATNFEGAPSHISYNQVDWVARKCQTEGLRPLIILHSRHTAKVPNDYSGIVEAWRREGILYSTPAGANDDWFWMYVAVFLRCTHVVTNDIMRDHHFLLLSPRWFGRWRERHQVKFSFGQWEARKGTGAMPGERARQVSLIRPLPYSYRVQKLQEGGVVAVAIPKYIRSDGAAAEDGPAVASEDGRSKWWCAFKISA